MVFRFSCTPSGRLEKWCILGFCGVQEKPPGVMWRHSAVAHFAGRIGWGPVVPGVCTVHRLVLTPTVTTVEPHAALCPTIKFLSESDVGRARVGGAAWAVGTAVCGSGSGGLRRGRDTGEVTFNGTVAVERAGST